MLKKINQHLDKIRQFEDDFDGEYVYKKEFDPITSFISNVWTKTTVKKDRRKRAFGRIKGNIFYYITVPMVVILGLVSWAAVTAFPRLLPYFETNVFLNGLIISLMIFGILKTFYNSFLLYKTAYFFRLLEDIIRQDTVPITDVYKLRRSLEKDGYLVNTIAMSETIDNIEKFGHPNFNDHRARLIKSKMGFRVNKNKANVSYISGILVMLGLLGTFLGLLGTIDSVGAALGGMGNMGQGGEVTSEDMNMFISSLAAPLEGMGLAFSSSLFGLSGSLLIGFFLYLGGTPQNYFIENISRWIDDRIPVHKPQHLKAVVEGKEKDGKKGETKKEEAKINPSVKDQDLKDWLSGYVYMSVKTNKQIENLCAEISSSTSEIQQVTQDNQVIRQTQTHLIDVMNSNNMLLENIATNNQSVAQEITRVAQTGEQLNSQLTDIKVNQDNGNAILSNLESQMKMIGTSLENNKDVAEKLHNNTTLISQLIEQNNKDVVQQLDNNTALTSQLIEQNEKQFGISSDFDRKALDLLNLIKDIAQDSNKIRLSSDNTYKENASVTAKSLQAIQENLGSIIKQFDVIDKGMKSNDIKSNISSIEGFVEKINNSQKELLKSSEALKKEAADSVFASKNVTLIQKMEDKISKLEDDLKKLFKK